MVRGMKLCPWEFPSPGETKSLPGDPRSVGKGTAPILRELPVGSEEKKRTNA